MKYIFTPFKKILGIILIVIGIPGLFLPLLQGMLFISIGTILLGGKPALKKLKQLKNYIIGWFRAKT